jgi:hypothetical protein
MQGHLDAAYDSKVTHERLDEPGQPDAHDLPA